MELFKRRNFYYWILQIGGWTFFVAFIVMMNLLVGEPNEDGSSVLDTTVLFGILLFLVVNLGLSHLVRVLIKSFGGLPQHILKFLWVGILIAFLFGVTSSSVDYALDIIFEIPNSQSYWDYVLNNAIGLGLLKFIWLLIYFGFHLYERIQQQRIQNLQLESAKNESELLSLRRQLNPHFIFNALNSVKALVDDEPAKAKKAITKISSILRTTLTTNKEHFVALKVELDLVESYLGLEKIRFEERLSYQVNCSPELNHYVVPPFSIQNLVENAIKHGISKLASGGEILVDIQKKDTFLCVEVKNTGYLSSEKSDTNIGIQNINKRLGLLFDQFEFKLIQEEEMVVAQMLIPQKTML